MARYDIGAYEYTPTSTATTYYASNNGTGNGLSQGSPFKLSDFWLVASAGKTCYLLNGTYQGANNMLTPTSGLSGSSGSTINIIALNDGQVTIDGQNARRPCLLSNNDYFDIEGINFKNSPNDVVAITSGSDNNIFRRCIAYNAGVANDSQVWLVTGTNNLLEDCAGFGTGRTTFMNSGSTGTTWRRCFAQWNRSTVANLTMSCYTAAFNSYDTTVENCIGTRHELVTPNVIRPIFATERMTAPTTDLKAYAQFLGCIGIVLSSQTVTDGTNGLILGSKNHDYVIYENTVIHIAANTHTGLTAVNGQTYSNVDNPGAPASASGCNRQFTSMSIIGATPADTIDTSSPNGWTKTNYRTATSVTALYGSQSLYVNDGTKGATIQYRYVDGAITSTFLWPWPMNQRIIDAMTANGQTAFNVDTTMNTIFNPPASFNLSMPTIASGTVLRTPTVAAVGAFAVTTPTPISSTVLRTPTVTTTYTLLPPTKTSTATLFAPSVTIGIRPPTISAGTTLYTPTVAKTGSQALLPPTIAATTALYAPTVAAQAAKAVTGATVGTTVTLYPPSVARVGAASLTGVPIASTVTLYPPSLATTASLTGGTISSGVSLHAPSLAAGVRPPSLSGTLLTPPSVAQIGNFAVTGPTIPSGTALHAPSLANAQSNANVQMFIIF